MSKTCWDLCIQVGVKLFTICLSTCYFSFIFNRTVCCYNRLTTRISDIKNLQVDLPYFFSRFRRPSSQTKSCHVDSFSTGAQYWPCQWFSLSPSSVLSVPWCGGLLTRKGVGLICRYISHGYFLSYTTIS